MNRWKDDERLADWVDGRLDDDEVARLEAEFAAEPGFRAAAEGYRRTVEAVRSALHGAERPRAGLADRVLARAAAEAAGPAETSPRLRLVPWIGSVAAAAAIVLAFVWIRGVAEDTSPDARRTAYTDESARPDVAPDPSRYESDPAADAFGVAGERSREDGDTAMRRIVGDDEALGDRTVTAPSSGRAARTAPEEGAAAERHDDDAGAVAPSAAAEPMKVDAEQEGQGALEDLGRAGAPGRGSGGRGAVAPGTELRLGAASRTIDPSATVDPALGTLVYLVELPPVPERGATVTAEPNVRRAREAPPPPVPAAPADNGLAGWQGYAFGFVQAPIQSTEIWTANVLPPSVDALDVSVLQLAFKPAADTLAQRPGKEEAEAAAEADTVDVAGTYQAREGDAAFRLAGDPQQLDAYLTRIMTSVAAHGGRLDLQRTLFVPGPWVAEQQLAKREQKDADAPAQTTPESEVLLVLRQQVIPAAAGEADPKSDKK